jgi:hypothetical protein
MSEALDEHKGLLDSAERQGRRPLAGCVEPRGLRQEREPIPRPHNFLTFVPYHWLMHMSSQHGSPISSLAGTV